MAGSHRKCWVPFCESKKTPNCNKISFHSFPSNVKMRQAWIKAIYTQTGLESPFLVSEISVVCSEHFDDTCFKDFATIRALKRDAVPTKFKVLTSLEKRVYPMMYKVSSWTDMVVLNQAGEQVNCNAEKKVFESEVTEDPLSTTLVVSFNKREKVDAEPEENDSNTEDALIKTEDTEAEHEVFIKTEDRFLNSEEDDQEGFLSASQPVVATDWDTLRCNCCSYKTKHPPALKQHMASHGEPSKSIRYQCTKCDYKSSYKNCLKKHLTKHEDSSQLKMYVCGICSFRTKYRHALKRHGLVHKDSSEVQWYPCDACEFKSKYKSHLKSHTKIHGYTIASLLSVHGNMSRIEVFQCEVCEYKTRLKRNLRVHMHNHAVALELKTCAGT